MGEFLLRFSFGWVFTFFHPFAVSPCSLEQSLSSPGSQPRSLAPAGLRAAKARAAAGGRISFPRDTGCSQPGGVRQAAGDSAGGFGGLGAWSASCLRGMGLRTSSPVCLLVQVWGFAVSPGGLRGLSGPAGFPLPSQHGSGAGGGLGGERGAESLGVEGTGVGVGAVVGRGEGHRLAPARMQRPRGRQSVPKSQGRTAGSWWQPSPLGRLCRSGATKPRVTFPFVFASVWHRVTGSRGVWALLGKGGSAWGKDPPLVRATARTSAVGRASPSSGRSAVRAGALHGLGRCSREFLRSDRKIRPSEVAGRRLGSAVPSEGRRVPSWQRQPRKTSTNLEV